MATTARDSMVESQLVSRGIRDMRVLQAMREVAREDFVGIDLSEFAYEDTPLPIEEGQTISQPFMVALMTEALELKEGDRVLEIGTGSGYAAAILSRVAAEVYTVERMASLAHLAAKRLVKAGYDNVHVLRGDGTLGVIYRPETELHSHYFQASLPRQFDEYIWFNETNPVSPLGPEAGTGLPETFPFGL